MISERVRAVGSFDLRLRPDTPRTILGPGGVDWFGHIVVTSAHVESRGLTSVELLAAARYTGILRSRRTEFDIAGCGLAAWLGDEDGKGILIELDTVGTGDEVATGTFAEWFAALVPAYNLTANAVTGSVTGTLDNETAQFETYRHALDYMVDMFSQIHGAPVEWRVNSDGTVDAGPVADLYGASPTAIVQRLSGGRDINVTGIRATLDLAGDVEDLVTRIVVEGDVGYGVAQIGGTAYKNLLGADISITRLVQESATAAGNEDDRAAQILDAEDNSRAEITVTADEYDVGSIVACGAPLWVYEPILGLIDTTNPVPYRGEILFPVSKRVVGLTWPIRSGMGVYYRAHDGTITDLTEWVEFEDGPARIEVDAPARTFSAALA